MARPKLLISFVLLALIVSCASVDTETNARQAGAHFKIGVSYLYENKIQQAFVEFQSAYELDRNNKEVLNAIGIIYLQYFDETAKAIDFFQKAIRIDPDYSEAHNNLGYANYRLGQLDAAIASYKKAVSNLLYTTPEKAYVNMGRTYYRLGRYDESITAYREAIKRAPDLDLPYFGLALCFNISGKYGEASAALTHAIGLSPFYKGNLKMAAEDFGARKLSASGHEKKDLADYLEILKY